MRERERLIEAGELGWEPDHPETKGAWPFWQALISMPGLDFATADQMLPEEIADVLEAVAVAADVQLWHRDQARS